MAETLTLVAAIRSGQLDRFIQQEEARGVGPAFHADLDRALSRLIKAPKSGDQTSRSGERDGSTGK